MAKKCKGCNVPLEGFMAKIASLAGVKPSTKNPDYCNKCEAKMNAETNPAPAPEVPAPVESMEKTLESQAPAESAPDQPAAPVTESTPEPVSPQLTPEPPKPAEDDMFEATEPIAEPEGEEKK